MAGAFGNRFRARGGWGCGSGAVRSESAAHRIPNRCGFFCCQLRSPRSLPSRPPASWGRGGEENRHRVALRRRQNRTRGELAAELVRLQVDVTSPLAQIQPVHRKAATTTIPIVMGQDPDPVGNGFVASLAQPGGNITDRALYTRNERQTMVLFKQTDPKLSRVGVLGDSTNPGEAQTSKKCSSRRGVAYEYYFLCLQCQGD